MVKEEFIDLCKEIAQNSDGRFKHGAILIKGKNILAQGYNYNYVHPLHGKWSMHAEENVIQQVKNKYGKSILSSCILYVIRVNRHDQIMNSAPCTNCKKLIKKYNILTFYSV